jgi:hypothetical protein
MLPPKSSFTPRESAAFRLSPQETTRLVAWLSSNGAFAGPGLTFAT